MSWAKAILAAGLCFLSALTIAAGARSAGANVDELMRLSAAATKTYVSPLGSGQRNGTSPDNAYGFSSLTRHLRDLKASTTLYFVPGTYHLRKTLSVTAPANGILHLKGAPGVVFNGEFQLGEDNHEASGIRLGSGDIILENINFDHTRNCVRVEQRYSAWNVYLRQIEARGVLDIKADGVVRRRVSADGGHGSHYNYKLWNYDHYLCIKC